MTLALLCSGQGRQDCAMFDLFGDAPAATSILAEAGRLLGQDAREMLRSADDAALYANRTSQILCVARGLIAAACVAPSRPVIVAGYSVGEMAAWGIAGLWSAEETLRLTAIRAEAMDAAGGPDDGLGFIRGLPIDRVADLTRRFDCAIGIVNPAQMFVIGGMRADVARCCEAALAAGAIRARPIAVHVASHTPRLSGAVAPFRAALAATDVARPAPGRMLLSTTGPAIVRGMSGTDGLAAQIDTTIDWAATLEALVERGVDRMLELGPGTALADMVRVAYPAIDVRAVDDFRSREGIAAWID